MRDGWLDPKTRRAAGTAAALLLLAVSCSPRPSVEEMLAAYRENGAYPALTIHYPLEGTVFPPDMAPPTLVWEETNPRPDGWAIAVEFSGRAPRLVFASQHPQWTFPEQAWARIQAQSRDQPATVTVVAFQRRPRPTIVGHGRVGVRTSADAVGAPLFYREVNLPFFDAVKDPSRIRWRFGSVGSLRPPPVVLEGLPVCGNCHSFSSDGRVLGMDVDYANDKGSYTIASVARDIVLASSNVITWSDYRRDDPVQTFGLLSQVSPDGTAVVSTVKDKSVFVPKPDLAFSQLFFPIQGILVVYRRDTGRFEALPGADDPAYVQTNPSWSPDGQYLVFARAPAYRLRSADAQNKLLLTADDCAEFVEEGKPFPFDLYRIPYNQGRGGVAEPLAGASRNGRSNFFPKYSPDGRWIVFCQARNYMLLQPDSELFIVPAAGGTARRLRSNTARMNSWHSWSPNGRWLVFASKANSAYTQLFLTHIDEAGDSTPPVLLDRMTAPDRAANIPEFVNLPPDAIARIHEKFLDDYSHARSGYVLEKGGDVEGAIREYRAALKVNPGNVHAHQRLGFLLYHSQRQFEAGLSHTLEALRLDPNDACAHHDLGMALLHKKQLDQAIRHLARAVELMPQGFDRRYNPVDMRFNWAAALIADGNIEAATPVLIEVTRLDPSNANARYTLALAQAAQGLIDEPVHQYALARSLRADLDTAPELPDLIARNYAQARQFPQAIESAQRALELARARGDPSLVQTLEARLDAYRRNARP